MRTRSNDVREEIIENLTKRYKKIERSINRTRKGRGPTFSSLFRTDVGKRFGRGADKLQKFVTKGVYIIFPFQKFVGELKTLYSDDRYKSMIADAGATDSDIDFVEYIRKEILDDLDNVQTGQLFNREDEKLFLGTLTSSLYAYADCYSKDALSLVMKIPGSERRILRNLGHADLRFSFSEVEHILESPKQELRHIALSAARSSAFLERFKLMKSGLGIWTEIDKSLAATSLENYKSQFEDFVGLRGKIAHQYPSPTIKEFLQNAYIRSGVDNLKAFFEQDIQNLTLPNPVFEGFFGCIVDWMRRRLTPFGIILQLVAMATIYPAILDNAIHILAEVG